MKNITTIDFITWNENAKKMVTEKINWTPDTSPEFLDHTLPILASIPLPRQSNGKISANAVINALNTDDLIDTPNGTMPAKQIRAMIGFLYQYPRSNLIEGSQIKNSRLATLTPLLLYANKLFNNVKYSEWDKTDGSLGVFLGYQLSEILKVKGNPKGLTPQRILNLRNEALKTKTGRTKGTIVPVTHYKMSIRAIDETPYPKIALFMYLQTWLANAAVRNTDSMILDPVNWDNIPEAVDQSVPAVAEPQTSTDRLMII